MTNIYMGIFRLQASKTINPNNSGVKRYIDVAVTAGDVFDKIYFEQE